MLSFPLRAGMREGTLRPPPFGGKAAKLFGKVQGSLVAQVQEAVELLYADSHSDDYLAARLRGMG